MVLNTKQFNTIKSLLECNGYNDINYENIKEKIIQFQNKKKLTPDGILGPNTLWSLQYERVIDTKDYSFETISVDKYKESYKTFLVRSDIAPSLINVYNEMNRLKSILPSSGGYRELNARVSAGRSATSFHYTALAIDIYIWGGLQDPENDPFVLDYQKYDRIFEVYARSNSELIENKEIKAYYISNSGLKSKVVKGRFFSLTKLMRKNGFTPIQTYESFHRDPIANYTSAEWWHFQNNTVLTPYVSQFGIELLKLYSLKDLKASPVWESRKAIFQRNGFYKKIQKYLK